MKKSIYSLFALIVILIFAGCEKDESSNPADSNNLSITLNDPSEISETSFVANWNIDAGDYDSLVVELSRTDSESDIFHRVDITDKNVNSQVFDGLNGKTKYFYRIVVWKSNQIINSTEFASLRTKCKEVTVNFETSDNYTLFGTVYYLENGKKKKPGIIFMHEWGYKDPQQMVHLPMDGWIDSEVMDELIASDYVCMHFYYRGHYKSESFDIVTFISGPEYLNNDLKAAVQFLQNLEYVISDSIILIGANIGADGSAMGNCLNGVVASVAVSSPGWFPTNVNCRDEKPKNILIIAGEKEAVPTAFNKNVDWAAEALALYNNSDEPKKLIIVPNAEETGTNLMKYPDVVEEIVNWVKSYM